MTNQPNQPDPTPKPTGDQIMTAARDAIAEEFPGAAKTASGHANRVANRLCQVLADPAAWDKK